MIVLLDTCVLIDVLQDRQSFSEDGKKIFYLKQFWRQALAMAWLACYLFFRVKLYFTTLYHKKAAGFTAALID